MDKRILSYFTLIILVLFSTLIVWFPFLFKQRLWLGLDFDDYNNFLTIYRQFDGLLYIIPAKTLYSPKLIDSLRLELSLPVEYFAAHLPLYPLLIRVFSFFGYPQAMVLVNILSTISLSLLFYFILKRLRLSTKPFILTTVFLFLPRFLVVRSTGAPESLFIFLILSSLFLFETRNFLWSGIVGALATATKTPGILLFFVYLVVMIETWRSRKVFNLKWLSICLIPLGLLVVFTVYAFQYGDFLAYFHTGGFVPLLYPYSVFNYQARWVGTAWLEDVIFYFFLYGLTVYNLRNSQYRSFFYFTLIFFIATVFIQHRDIARYSLPLWPFACIAGEKFLTSRKFILILIILLPAIYLYAWNFLLYNLLPVADWRPYL